MDLIYMSQDRIVFSDKNQKWNSNIFILRNQISTGHTYTLKYCLREESWTLIEMKKLLIGEYSQFKSLQNFS